MALKDFAGTQAHAKLLSALCDRSGLKREQKGDLLNAPTEVRATLDAPASGCFANRFQGDHGRVEFATAAHEGLLRSWNLLSPKHRLTSAAPVPLASPWQALMIDDFFALSTEPVDGFQGLSGLDLEATLPWTALRLFTAQTLLFLEAPSAMQELDPASLRLSGLLQTKTGTTQYWRVDWTLRPRRGPTLLISFRVTACLERKGPAWIYQPSRAPGIAAKASWPGL